MHKLRRSNDFAMWHMHELSARVVAESGFSHDRYHMGKLILQSLKDAPDFVLQIDGGTGQSETCGSVLERSVKCANAMRALGLQRGDVIILMAPNYLELCLPYYAALFLGVSIAPTDQTLQIKELQDLFAIDEPKIIFCESKRVKDIRIALENCKLLNAKVVTFDENPEKSSTTLTFEELINKHGHGDSVDDFKASEFDPEDTTALLISTSGTTGLPKQSVSTQKHFAITGYHVWDRYTDFPTPIRLAVVLSPLQWLSAIVCFNNAPLLRFTRLQSSSNLTQQHCCDLINKYKPDFTILSPTFLTSLATSDDLKCDFSCFETIFTGGSAVSSDLIKKMKKAYPEAEIFNLYGMSEISCLALSWDNQAVGSSGKPATYLQYRLVDVETGHDIIEPNKPGELWLRGPSIFKGYYKNAEATADALTKDGWYKTGDLLYRDEYWNFYFVDRIKLLLKYRNHQISPVEIENVIRQHPGVMDVAVTGIPDEKCGDLPVACVVLRKGSKVSAQEIKNLVKESLADSKQLRGGVIFLNEIPVFPNTKINYKKLKEIAIHINKQ